MLKTLFPILMKMVSIPSKLSIAEQRENLPIYKLKEQLMETIKDNQITIIVGETGSGKSTQITQYLAESKMYGKICCTQPRRVAAVSLAQRVAEEFGCELGKDVGYSVRFSNMISEETVIHYMTDGILLRKCKSDPDFLKYSVIILDEAHERTIHTDTLFALLKSVVPRRPEFKLIVTSATLDAGKFSEYFLNAPIFTIPGRTFPVDIFYSEKPETSYIEESVRRVLKIHLREEPGDILLFLPGEKEIMKACKALESKAEYFSHNEDKLLILPMYSALPTAKQENVFQPTPAGCRKVVIATNIAETSLTIDGISYVIDPGYVKIMTYNPETGQKTLEEILISQAQAKQRMGRAGRTRPGKCYRLYSEEDYEKLSPTTVPAIKNSDLISVILQLKFIGCTDIINFDFMDPPETMFITTALKQLQSLLALDEDQNMTRLGKLMSEFPLIPNLSKCLISSVKFGCSDEMLTIVSLLSGDGVFCKPILKKSNHETFYHPNGDHLRLLEVYNEWKNNDFSSSWCRENQINEDNLALARNVREQLLKKMKYKRLSILSCNEDSERIGKAFCSGFFENVAVRKASGLYKTLRGNTMVKIHPSSSLYKENLKLVVYKEIIMTNHTTNMHIVEPCKYEWLKEPRKMRNKNLNISNQQNGLSSFKDEDNFETSVSSENADEAEDNQNMNKLTNKFRKPRKTSVSSENESEGIDSKIIAEGIRIIQLSCTYVSRSHISNQNNHARKLYNRKRNCNISKELNELRKPSPIRKICSSNKKFDSEGAKKRKEAYRIAKRVKRKQQKYEKKLCKIMFYNGRKHRAKFYKDTDSN